MTWLLKAHPLIEKDIKKWQKELRDCEDFSQKAIPACDGRQPVPINPLLERLYHVNACSITIITYQ